MKNTKVIKTLKLLTHSEIKDFKHFVNSPYFNRTKKCKEIYQLLLKHAPDFDSEELNHPDFFKSITTKKKYLVVLLSEFVRLLEEYMAQIRIRKNEVYQKYFLLEELRERGAWQHFNLIHAYCLKKNRVKEKNTENYYIEFLLEFSKLNMLYDHVVDEKDRVEHLLKTIKAFDKYIIINHLLLDNTVLNEESAIRIKETADLIQNTTSNMDKFIEMGEQESNKSKILIQLHLLLSKLYQNEKEEDFVALYDVLDLNYEKIDKNDCAIFFRGMANFLTKKINHARKNNTNNASYYSIALLHVYSFALKAEIFLDGNYLNIARMKNIIIVAANLGEIDWAGEVLEEHITSIEPKYQKSVKNYCYGYLYLQEAKTEKEAKKGKQYDLSEESFRICYNCRSIFELDAVVHLYQIYYTRNKDEEFERPIINLITRLNRDKERYSKENRMGCLNFLRILKRVHKKRADQQIFRKVESQRYKQGVKRIKEDFAAMKYVLGKRWLLAEINKL